MRVIRHSVRAFLVILLIGATFIALGNIAMVRYYAPRIATSVQTTQAAPLALVLGTSHWSRNGEPSEHFRGRMDAAAALFSGGKVRALLLSGANPSIHYNEPQRMREALQQRGVPPEAMVLDYAGRRTLDSVRRARDVFGAKQLIIVSQRYHLYRALFLADADGLTAQGLAASGPDLPSRWRTEWREVLARVLAVLDVYVLGTEPHFPAQGQSADDTTS